METWRAIPNNSLATFATADGYYQVADVDLLVACENSACERRRQAEQHQSGSYRDGSAYFVAWHTGGNIKQRHPIDERPQYGQRESRDVR